VQIISGVKKRQHNGFRVFELNPDTRVLSAVGSVLNFQNIKNMVIMDQKVYWVLLDNNSLYLTNTIPLFSTETVFAQMHFHAICQFDSTHILAVNQTGEFSLFEALPGRKGFIQTPHNGRFYLDQTTYGKVVQTQMISQDTLAVLTDKFFIIFKFTGGFNGTINTVNSTEFSRYGLPGGGALSGAEEFVDNENFVWVRLHTNPTLIPGSAAVNTTKLVRFKWEPVSKSFGNIFAVDPPHGYKQMLLVDSTGNLGVQIDNSFSEITPPDVSSKTIIANLFPSTTHFIIRPLFPPSTPAPAQTVQTQTAPIIAYDLRDPKHPQDFAVLLGGPVPVGIKSPSNKLRLGETFTVAELVKEVNAPSALLGGTFKYYFGDCALDELQAVGLDWDGTNLSAITGKEQKDISREKIAKLLSDGVRRKRPVLFSTTTADPACFKLLQ
ncbi:MAG: hypothetical protein HY072_04120, partial [Deltaproteobacteria bacterium]|nr:hypothetical protein [Deltaproteobacteria bacterium]